jgi:hypothetical protein
MDDVRSILNRPPTSKQVFAINLIVVLIIIHHLLRGDFIYSPSWKILFFL